MADRIDPRAAGIGAGVALAIVVPVTVVARIAVPHPENTRWPYLLFAVIMAAFVIGGAVAGRLAAGRGPAHGAAAGLVAVLVVLAYSVVAGTSPPLLGVIVYLALFAALGAVGGLLASTVRGSET